MRLQTDDVYNIVILCMYVYVCASKIIQNCFKQAVAFLLSFPKFSNNPVFQISMFRK